MDSMNSQEPAREVLRAQANREELVEQIARALPEDGKAEPLKGLLLARVSSPTQGFYGVPQPSFCVVAQGNKEVLLGDQRYRYDPYHYLLTTVELPVVGQVLEASEDQPYLSLRLTLDDDLDAATAGYRVGYDDPSHFNREYKRLFGEPPVRDVERLRDAARVSARTAD